MILWVLLVCLLLQGSFFPQLQLLPVEPVVLGADFKFGFEGLGKDQGIPVAGI